MPKQPLTEVFSQHLGMIDVYHARVHNGVAFACELFQANLGAGASLNMLLKPPAGEVPPHVLPGFASTGEARLFLYEGPTTSADGTALPRVNRNRLSANNANLEVFSGPTVSDDGELLTQLLVGGGGFFTPAGGEIDFSQEFILAPGTDYLLRLTNEAASAQDTLLKLYWYEGVASGGS